MGIIGVGMSLLLDAVVERIFRILLLGDKWAMAL
jgi:hypothetical protein